MSWISDMPKLVWGFIALIGLVIGLNVWVYYQQRVAVKAREEQITQATKAQVAKDEQLVIEAYKPNSAIESHVDGMLSAEPEATSGGDRLLSAKADTRALDRPEASTDRVPPAVLSDQETNFVFEHADVLQ